MYNMGNIVILMLLALDGIFSQSIKNKRPLAFPQYQILTCALVLLDWQKNGTARQSSSCTTRLKNYLPSKIKH